MALHEMILFGMIPPVPLLPVRAAICRARAGTSEPKWFCRAMWFL
jgi:hypothetical protein